MKYPLYNCIVRPGGWIMHEVPKFDVTAAEIAVIRFKHGADDAVTKIEDNGKTIDMTERKIRTHLIGIYGEKAVYESIGKFGGVPTTEEDLTPLVAATEDPEELDESEAA